MPYVDGVGYPGPWQMRFNYVTATSFGNRQHVLRMNMDVDTPPDAGSDFNQYDLISRAGLYYNAETWADAFAAAMADIYYTGSTIVDAELWKFESGTNNGAYQSSYTLSVAGTSASPSNANGQAVMSARCQDGGIAYLHFMESIATAGPKYTYATAGVTVQAIWDLITANNSPMLGRDGSYAFSPLYYLPGQNEHWFKESYR